MQNDISDNFFGIKSISPMILKDFIGNISVSDKKLLEDDAVEDEYYVVEVSFTNTSEIDVLDACYAKYGNIFLDTITVPYSYGVVAIAANDIEYKLISYSLLDGDKTIYKHSTVLEQYKKYNIYPILYIRNGQIADNKLIRNSTLYSLVNEASIACKFLPNKEYSIERSVTNESITIEDDAEDSNFCFITSAANFSIFLNKPKLSNTFIISQLKVYKNRSYVVLAVNNTTKETLVNSFTYNDIEGFRFDDILNGYKDYTIIPIFYINYGKIIKNYIAPKISINTNDIFKYVPDTVDAAVIQDAVKDVQILTTNGKLVEDFAVTSIRNGNNTDVEYAFTLNRVNKGTQVDTSTFVKISNNSVEAQTGIITYEKDVSLIGAPEIKHIKITIDWDKVPELGIGYRCYGYNVYTALSSTVYSKYQEEKINTSEPPIYVDANGGGDYTSLQDAIDNAGDSKDNPKVIIVMPGTYVMPAYDSTTRYKGSNRYLSIIGTDRNSCIVRNDNGYYCVSPYVDNGVIKM